MSSTCKVSGVGVPTKLYGNLREDKANLVLTIEASCLPVSNHLSFLAPLFPTTIFS